jgi:hypothetical protein
VTASAVLRVGAHAPVAIHGTPAAAAECTPGEVTIALGYDSYGLAVTLVITSVEWADDLTDAASCAAARGIVRSGMTRHVPAAAVTA